MTDDLQHIINNLCNSEAEENAVISAFDLVVKKYSHLYQEASSYQKQNHLQSANSKKLLKTADILFKLGKDDLAFELSQAADTALFTPQTVDAVITDAKTLIKYYLTGEATSTLRIALSLFGATPVMTTSRYNNIFATAVKQALHSELEK
jgi:hypothetical protein